MRSPRRRQAATTTASPAAAAAAATPQPASSKSYWPDLVGFKGEEAVAAIKKDRPYLQVFVIPEGSIVTMDFREDRVRVWVDDNGSVAQAPLVG